MLLTGTFFRTLDDKQRLSIPKRLREALGHPHRKKFYVVRGTDDSLAMYGEEEFERLGAMLGQGSPVQQDVRTFSRLFYSQADSVELDGQGRVRIPPELCRLAGLEKEIVLLGVRDHVEMWERTRWEAYLNANQPIYDNLAERAFQRQEPAPPAPAAPSAPPTDPIPPQHDQRPNQPR